VKGTIVIGQQQGMKVVERLIVIGQQGIEEVLNNNWYEEGKHE